MDTLFLAAPIRDGSRTLGTLVVATDLTRLEADQHRVLVLVGAEALVALVGAVAGAYLLLRRLLRTVGRITTTAASIEDGDLDRRLGDQGTDDEMGQLAATFDSMLDRLQAAMVVQRRPALGRLPPAPDPDDGGPRATSRSWPASRPPTCRGARDGGAWSSRSSTTCGPWSSAC